MPQGPSPSWDLFLVLIFVIGAAYGFLLQRGKVVLTLISVYVALLMANILTPVLLNFFAGNTALFNQFFIKLNLSELTIKTGVFVLAVILLVTKSGLSSTSSRGLMAPIEILGFSVLNTALIISTIFSFMPPERQEAFKQASRLAKLIIEKQTWWLILPIILLIATGFRRRTRSEE